MISDCIIATAQGADAASGLADSTALSVLLTTESLLFAALGVSVALTSSADDGRPHYVATGKMARDIAFVLTVVAFGAATAWLDVFCDPWPDGFRNQAQAVGIAAGIGLEVYFAWRIALAVRLRVSS